MLDHETLKHCSELASVCHLAYGDSVRHTNYTYKSIPFNHQLIINGRFGRGYCRLFWHEESVVVTFRGQRRSLDWMTANFHASRAPLNDCTDAQGVTVHRGFQKTLDYGEVVADVRALDEIIGRLQQFDLMQSHMTITGHAMGGALAILFAAKLRCLFPETASELQKIITFGSPAVAGRGFKDYYGDLNDITLRIVNKADPLPYTPAMFYEHVGEEICLQGERPKRPLYGLSGLLLSKSTDYDIKTYIENLSALLDKF